MKAFQYKILTFVLLFSPMLDARVLQNEIDKENKELVAASRVSDLFDNNALGKEYRDVGFRLYSAIDDIKSFRKNRGNVLLHPEDKEEFKKLKEEFYAALSAAESVKPEVEKLNAENEKIAEDDSYLSVDQVKKYYAKIDALETQLLEADLPGKRDRDSDDYKVYQTARAKIARLRSEVEQLKVNELVKFDEHIRVEQAYLDHQVSSRSSSTQEGAPAADNRAPETGSYPGQQSGQNQAQHGSAASGGAGASQSAKSSAQRLGIRATSTNASAKSAAQRRSQRSWAQPFNGSAQ